MADVRGASGVPSVNAFGGVSTPTPSTPLYIDLQNGDGYVLVDNVVTKVFSVTSGGATATTVEKNLGSNPAWRGKFTITDSEISATSKVLCWQAPGPYTGKGTLADEAEMQPVQVVATNPAAGSAVVMWETPPMVAMTQQLNNGRLTPAGATFDRLMNQRTPSVFTANRINKVRGNVKFSYMVLS